MKFSVYLKNYFAIIFVIGTFEGVLEIFKLEDIVMIPVYKFIKCKFQKTLTLPFRLPVGTI